jgi:hypothetical protein
MEKEKATGGGREKQKDGDIKTHLWKKALKEKN